MDSATLQLAEGGLPTHEVDEPEHSNITAETKCRHLFTSDNVAGRSSLSGPEVSLQRREDVAFAEPQKRHSTGSPNKMDSDI